jgi:hypothetical protein
MINIVNHPYLASLVSQTNWEDSGKFVALGELIDTLGFEGEKSITQNKVFLSLFRLLSLLERKPLSTSSKNSLKMFTQLFVFLNLPPMLNRVRDLQLPKLLTETAI